VSRAAPGEYVGGTEANQLKLTEDIIRDSVVYVHDVLDSLDQTLVLKKEPRMSELLELANLSAVVGNLFRGGIANCSDGLFVANGPHKYPDLLSNSPEVDDVEIKVALENNNPKGHLVKPGPHIAVRYVLGSPDGEFARGKDNRGNTVWIWEVRCGILEEHHFNVSNTAGDSGKTAVLNKEGMATLRPVYFDRTRCPLSPRGSLYRSYNYFTEQLV